MNLLSIKTLRTYAVPFVVGALAFFGLSFDLGWKLTLYRLGGSPIPLLVWFLLSTLMYVALAYTCYLIKAKNQ